jgi:hypothetical protein
MKLGVGGWIGVIIGGLGGLIGMVVAIMASPVFGSIFTLIFIVIFGGVFWSFFFKPMMVRNKLSKTGVAATARIVSLSDTGVTVNMNPQIKLLLEVTPPMGAPYQVEMKQVISRLDTASYQPGTILSVIVDPNDKNLIEINYDGGGSSSGASSYGTTGASAPQNSVTTGPWSGMSAAEADKKLIEINAQNVSLMSTGEPAKAIITKYTWLGIYVGEDNPAAQLELEVLPGSGSPFKATTIGILKATSVPKYQPGCEIYVAYDRNDTSKVTVTHS